MELKEVVMKECKSIRAEQSDMLDSEIFKIKPVLRKPPAQFGIQMYHKFN
jgi:hypothetical protein